uniref:Cell division protein n=1 Tax=Hydrodictyon reticulatum TaxID=3107 RepID=A0A1W5RNU3_HYDRE|nr:cell division protein [Hydrodictyon reticulatum]AQU64496.1 cell division protein [Hydrodictyon reticulatum]
MFQNFILLLNKKKRKKFSKKYVLLENFIYDFLNSRIDNLDNKNNTKNLQLEKIRIKEFNSFSQPIKSDRVLSFNENSSLLCSFSLPSFHFGGADAFASAKPKRAEKWRSGEAEASPKRKSEAEERKNLLIKSFQLNPGSFFPQKKIFMQYWIFPLIGFVGLTWNKNSNLFEIIDFKKSFLYSDKTNILNILINKKNEKYNLNQTPKSVESSFTFPLQQKQNNKKQESYQNDLYEYYFMAKSELEQKLSKLNDDGNQPAKFSSQNSPVCALLRTQEKNSMLLNSFLWSKSGTIEISPFFLNNKFNLKNQRNNILTADLNFNFSISRSVHIDKDKGNFFINTNLTNIVPTLTSNMHGSPSSASLFLPSFLPSARRSEQRSGEVEKWRSGEAEQQKSGEAREIYKKSPKKLLPVSIYYKNLNNKKKEGKNKSKTQRNKIKKNTLFSIIEIPNTFCIKPITQKQKGILHNHPIRSYEKAKILLDNAIKNYLLKETKNKDKNFKNIISIHSLDKLKNQSYFINKNITKSKLLFNFSTLKNSQQKKYLSESKIISNLFRIYDSEISYPSLSSTTKSNFLKVKNNHKIKENDIFVKKISEKLKFDLDKLLFSKKFKKNKILFNKINKQQNQKTNLKFLFLLDSNLKNTNNILKKFKKIKDSIPSIKENNIKNYIYELSVLNYWKKSLNLLNLNNNKISYSSKFFKKQRLFASFASFESEIQNLLCRSEQNKAKKQKISKRAAKEQRGTDPLDQDKKNKRSGDEFFNKFAKIQKLLSRNSKDSSLFTFQTLNLNPIKLKNSIGTSNLFYKENFNVLSNKIIYNKEQNLLYNYHLYSYNRNSKENYINKNFYRKNKKVLSKFMYKSILSKMNDFNKFPITNERLSTKFKNKKFKTSSDSKIQKNEGAFPLHKSELAEELHESTESKVQRAHPKNVDKALMHRSFAQSFDLWLRSLQQSLRIGIGSAEAEASEEAEASASSELMPKQKSEEDQDQEKNSINFIFQLKQISFINLNIFYKKLYLLINNLYKILSNDLTKKTTFLETNFNNIKIVKSHIQKKLIKKRNTFKIFKLDLNLKTFNKNFRRNKKEKIFRTLLSYKFSDAPHENANMLKGTSEILKKNNVSGHFAKLSKIGTPFLPLSGEAKIDEAEQSKGIRSLRRSLHFSASASASAEPMPMPKQEGEGEASASPLALAKKPMQLRIGKIEERTKLKKRMRNLLSIYSNNNNIQYKYYKKNTFKKINYLNSSSLLSQSVIVNKTKFEEKEKYYKNNISLNRILRRIGFVFLSELKIKKNYSQNRKHKITVPNLFINENQSVHSTRMLPFASTSAEPMASPKRAKEQRSGEKTQIMLDLEQSDFMNLNKKESLIKRFEKEKSLQKRRRRKKLKLETRRRKKRKRFYPRPVWLRYSVYKKFLNFRHSYNNFYYRKKVKTNSYKIFNNKKLSVYIPEKNEKIGNISNFFLKNEKLKNKIYRNNKQKWGNFIQDTPQFEKISLKKINFFPHFPVFQNKEYYKVSGRILAEFQPLCWKSYWLRSNLTPYMNRIEKNFSFMKQVEKTNNISNINSFLYKIFGFFSYDFYSFKFKMLPFYTDFKNSFDNQHAFYLSNLFFQESTNKIAEYNRIEFERFSEILKNVKFNMNLEGQLKPKSYKFIAWKYLLSSRELKTFNKKNFWYRLSYNMNPNISSVSPFGILSNTFSKNSASIKPYGSSGTLRALWTFNKTNIFTFKEKNQIRDLWEQTKLREQLKSNQTKKFLINLIKVNDYLYLKDIFYNSFLSFDFIHSIAALKDQDEKNKMLKKSSNFKDFKHLNSMNFSTIKKLQTAQRKLVLMCLFQQKSLALRKKSSNYILNNTNNISYNYYIRLLKSNISNSRLRSLTLLLALASPKRSQSLISEQLIKTKNFVFSYTLKNKKDSPLINTAKPRLLKPSSYFWWSSKNFQMPFNLNMFNDSYTNLFSLSESKIPNNLQFRTNNHYFESSNKKETLNIPTAQQPKPNKLIVYNILIFSILFHLSILFSFIRIPELRGLLKFQMLLFYKISNSYFIILYSIYDLLKKYKTETFKTYNSLYEKTYKLLSYINILDLESQSAHLFRSFGNSYYPGLYFGKETKKIVFSELKNPNNQIHSRFALSHTLHVSEKQEVKQVTDPLNQEKSNFYNFKYYYKDKISKNNKQKKQFSSYYFLYKISLYKNLKNNKYFSFLSSSAKGFASPLLRSHRQSERTEGRKSKRAAKEQQSNTLNPMSDLTLKSMNFYDRPNDISYSIKQWAFIREANNQSALKFPKIYNKDLKSYNGNNKKDLSSINLNKSFTTYITSQTPFIYSFSNNIVEFLYTKKILNIIASLPRSDSPSHQLRQSERTKLDIKKNLMTESYKRFISFRNIETYFALFFLYLSYGFVHLSIGLFESTYQFLLKIIDLFESFLLIIYKFLEKPAELMIEWIAQIFLIEWSSDPSSFIPETFDMYFWYSFQKFFRNTRILGFVEFQNSTNIYNIMNSLELNGFGIFDSKLNEKQIQFHNSNNDILSLEKTLGTSMFSFSVSNILSFFMQRRLWNFFHLFIDSMLKPDIDLIVRQKKGKIFWDIWADILIRAAEQYNINIPSLTSLKEEQEKLIERLIQDPAFINFSVLNSDYARFGGADAKAKRVEERKEEHKNFISSPLSNNLQSKIMSFANQKFHLENTTYNFKNKNKNKNKISPLLRFAPSHASALASPKQLLRQSFIGDAKAHNISNKNVLKNFYKTKSWSSNQYVTFNLKDTDLFLDISPPKSLLYVHFINGYEPIQYTLGSIMCEIYSGLFSHKVSKNLLIVNSHVSDLPLRSAISSNFLNSIKSSFDFQSRGSYGSLIIQALAGESEMKMMIDNANRYASIQRGVAVGMKLLRDVFESIVLQTPCFFLMEDLHIIGERRPMLISDDENSFASRENEFSIFGFEQDEESEKNQMIYQSSRHSINDFRRPYKGDFSMLIPTNLYNKDLYSFKTFLNNTKPTHQKKYPISLPSLLRVGGAEANTIENKMFDQSNDKQNNFSQSFNISRLQIASENFFAPPATSPFTILMMKEQRKLKPKKVVKQISWNSFVAENIIASKNDSIRVKVAILADMTLRNFSYNKDMITDLLVIIDGVRSNRGFVVFATTHLPSILDPALRRPGRFDETISLPLLPNLTNRWSLFQMHFGADSLYSVSERKQILQKKFSLFLPSFLPSLRSRRSREADKQRSGEVKKRSAPSLHGRLKDTFDRFDYGILTENFNFSQISNLISKTKLSCNVNYNSAKSPIIHPSQALQSFFIEKDSLALSHQLHHSQSEGAKAKLKRENKIISFNPSNRKKIYSQISFGYFQIGNLLISSDFLKDQTYFSLYNKSLILEQSSPFVFHTLYSSLNTFKMFIMRLLGGKIAEFLVSKNRPLLCSLRQSQCRGIGSAEAFAPRAKESNLYDSFTSINESKINTNKNLITYDKFNLSRSSFMKGSEKMQKLNFSIMDHMIRSKSWHFATSLIFSILQKRFLYNKNLIITKMLSFDNPNQSSLREPPSPPASSLLMPSKKYENFKRIERDFQQKATFSIYEKMQMHQKQRFLKRLYNKPVLESFKSQLFENRLTSFESSFKEFSYNKDSNLLKLSSSHSYYKNRLNIRHRFSLINQWWNGQLAEHNVEVTYLSDIDWRTMYIQSALLQSEGAKPKQTKQNHNNYSQSLNQQYFIGASTDKKDPDEPNNKSSYEKLGLKQSKSIFSYSKTSNKTDSMLDFPDADQHYNPRVRRWFLNANSWNYWLNFENTFYYEIYSHMIYDSFNKTSLYFNQNRELLDFFVYTYNIKGSLKEIDLIFIFSRFYRK